MPTEYVPLRCHKCKKVAARTLHTDGNRYHVYCLPPGPRLAVPSPPKTWKLCPVPVTPYRSVFAPDAAWPFQGSLP